jgi:large subunit ribosomal protein L31
MKKDIHPKYHEITVIMTDGSTFKTRSSFGKPNDTIQLDVDITTHPAWNAGKTVLKKTGAMDKFAAKFGDFNISSKKKPAA